MQSTLSLAEKIQRYLKQNNPLPLRRLLARQNFADIIDVLENHIEADDVRTCFQHLNVGKAAKVLSGLSNSLQRLCLAELPVGLSCKLLRQMSTDDAADILQGMEAEDSQRILNGMPLDADTKILQVLMQAAPDTAAGIMSTDFLKISVDATVADAFQLIRQAQEKDFIYYIYLVDALDKLIGVVSLKQLFLVSERLALSQVAEFDVKSLLLTFDQEFVATVFRKYYNLLSMPVTDSDNVICGIITIDDILSVIEEETSEDIYKASGISIEVTDERGLLVGSEFRAFRARFPFLSIALGGQFLTATIIAHYSQTVASAVIAISFLPLLTGLSGSIGSQSETITVRGLALNMIDDNNIITMLAREIRVAFIIAVFFALIVGGLTYGFYQNPYLSLLLASWIVVSQCVFAGIGMFIPYGLKRFFKVDPAGMGGPFITTVSDILTFLLYLSVVTVLVSKLQ
ncbi:MAG: magnesium transporter [Cyanobacteria bacterium P01_H01_bin.74]